jgi:serine/threonine protein kinase
VVFEGEARFLVMEFVEGHTLAQELAWHGRPGLPEATVIAWSLVLVKALAYLHGYQSPDGTPRPIVFRDLKPHNVMLRPDGRLTLVDFGIAHPLRSSGASTFGTSGYSPPEVYEGRAVPASDQYALAATIHQLLTGRDPSQAPPFIFPDPRLVVPSLGTRTADTLAQALGERPEDRFPTIEAFGAALTGRGLLAPASPGVVALGSRSGTRHGLAGSTAAGTAALVVTQPQVPLGPGRILTLVAGAGGLMMSAGFPLYVQSSYHTALYDSSTHGWGLAAVLALGAAFGSAVIRGSARSLPPTRLEAWTMAGVGVAGAAGSGLFIATSAHSAGGAAWLCSLPGLAGYFGLLASLLVIVGACLMRSEARP